MNRSIIRCALILLLLVSLPLLFAACDSEDCHHILMKETLHEPDCSHQGYILHECRSCSYSYKSDYTEPYGHTFSMGCSEPTCTEQGSTSYVCETCGYSYHSDYIAPLGHEFTSVVTAPTCTQNGYTTYTCTRDCGYSYTSDLVSPAGHSLASAYFAATCTTGSYTRYMCANCDLDYRSAVSEPLGHTFTDKTVYPSIAQTGYTSHTCHCGYSYVDNYVWYSDIFTGAKVDNTEILATGIDLSFWNTEVDWEALAATGIDYVILRAASGVQMPDVMFEEHYAGARRVGLDIGCYFYSYATTVEEARAEAEMLLDIIKGKQFEYPIYFDLEDRSQRLIDQQTLMDMCLEFCRTVAENGYFPAVYTNNDWLVNLWHAEALTTLYDVWYARYPLDDEGESHFPFGNWTHIPSYVGQYGMWQYTEFGRIDGVEGDVDLNFCYKDYPSHIKKYGYNGFAKE